MWILLRVPKTFGSRRGCYRAVNSSLRALLRTRPGSFPRLARRAGYLTSRRISAHPLSCVVDRVRFIVILQALSDHTLA